MVRLGGSGPSNGLFSDALDAADLTIRVGPSGNLQRLPLANRSVAEIRARYQDRLNLAPGSQAQLDGEPVTDTTVVRAGQTLTFVQRAGEKGRVARG
jgi:hypothetical protein